MHEICLPLLLITIRIGAFTEGLATGWRPLPNLFQNLLMGLQRALNRLLRTFEVDSKRSNPQRAGGRKTGDGCGKSLNHCALHASRQKTLSLSTIFFEVSLCAFRSPDSPCLWPLSACWPRFPRPPRTFTPCLRPIPTLSIPSKISIPSKTGGGGGGRATIPIVPIIPIIRTARAFGITGRAGTRRRATRSAAPRNRCRRGRWITRSQSIPHPP